MLVILMSFILLCAVFAAVAVGRLALDWRIEAFSRKIAQRQFLEDTLKRPED